MTPMMKSVSFFDLELSGWVVSLFRKGVTQPNMEKSNAEKSNRFKRNLNSFMYRLISLSQSGDVAAEPLRTMEFRAFR